MSCRKFAVALLIPCLLAVVLFVVLRVWDRNGGPLIPGPSYANFERLRIGMSLPEVEAILGPAGDSYSSETSYEYYIWKGRDGWNEVVVKQGKVSALTFDPTQSGGD